jgi:Holliday junction DNA helicase RuvA
MIAALSGTLRHVREESVHLQVGPILYELLVPACDLALLEAGVGQELTFHTLFYVQGDAGGGTMEPRLIGFLRAEDKRFFQKFITVKGIGPRRALRALAVPVGEIAQAIESKDARALLQLPEIGKRTAEQVVAELAGKVGEFCTPAGVRRTALAGRRAAAEEDAIAALMALGERRGDAEELLDRARAASPDMRSTDALVREMLRLRGTRA